MHMIARQRVMDYTKWKRVFDSHAPAQKEAGLEVTKILRNVDDPNDVFVLFEVRDLAKARRFVSSPTVPEARRDSGVIGDTEICFVS